MYSSANFRPVTRIKLALEEGQQAPVVPRDGTSPSVKPDVASTLRELGVQHRILRPGV